jgi:hypothetical protein
MNGLTLVGGGLLGNASNDWSVASLGDLNGNARADILWRHSSGALAVWLVDGTTVTGTGVIGGPSNGWTLQ